ncbi:unnamed protein product, partial [marine sediment metagenome]
MIKKMRKKLFVTLFVLSFLNIASISMLILPTTASTKGIINYTPVDIGWELRNKEVDFSAELESKE